MLWDLDGQEANFMWQSCSVAGLMFSQQWNQDAGGGFDEVVVGGGAWGVPVWWEERHGGWRHGRRRCVEGVGMVGGEQQGRSERDLWSVRV
jgi:hypothetical protein